MNPFILELNKMRVVNIFNDWVYVTCNCGHGSFYLHPNCPQKNCPVCQKLVYLKKQLGFQNQYTVEVVEQPETSNKQLIGFNR